MSYVVYHDMIHNSSASKELLNLRRWNGPIYENRVQLTMLYSEDDLNFYVEILRKYKINMYRKIRTENKFVKI